MERTFSERVLAVAAGQGPEHVVRAAAWLEELPRLVEGWRRHWRLGPLTRVPASIHWVGLSQREDGRGCVLKLAVPGAPQPRAEVTWLRRVAGPRPSARAAGSGELDVRAVQLLDADPAAGAQLLELVEPGEPLARDLVAAAGSPGFAAADDAACDVLAAAASAVRRPAPDPLVAGRAALGSVREHLDGLLDVAEHRDPRHRLLPVPLVATAAAQARQLLASAAAQGQPEVLLHGDLHHGNVLRSRPAAGRALGHGQDGWVVIDPHGVVGEAAYEVACAVYNPFELGQRAVERAAVRCERLAGTADLPLDRVRGWALVQSVLSAVWSLAGHDAAQPVPPEVRHTLSAAERLAG